DESQHAVTISRGFWIGRFLVTQEEYLGVVGSNPSYFTTNNGFTFDLQRPVDQVSWSDATNYCALLTARELAQGRIPTHCAYRLPTESEWEYACRAGTTTAFYLGDILSSGDANFWGKYGYDASTGQVYNASGVYLQATTRVGSYQPNGWGLYDMIGNLWEWCLDWYGPYPALPAIDPQGPTSGPSRVARGGDWGSFGRFCRSAQRSGSAPAPSSRKIGFRVVLAYNPS
ncbi:MAG TPA: formylglycine-generating enzyme family protein, partial [Verrucomicrobiae bacterium]|nr:formylglycine-generating enzyme family protein [Verrucomicrobiae bacterium]